MDRSRIAALALAGAAIFDTAFFVFALDLPGSALVLVVAHSIGLFAVAASCLRLERRSAQIVFVAGWTVVGLLAAYRIVMIFRDVPPELAIPGLIANAGFVAALALAAGAYVENKGILPFERTRYGAFIVAAGYVFLTLQAVKDDVEIQELWPIAATVAIYAVIGWALDTRLWQGRAGPS